MKALRSWLGIEIGHAAVLLILTGRELQHAGFRLANVAITVSPDPATRLRGRLRLVPSPRTETPPSCHGSPPAV